MSQENSGQLKQLKDKLTLLEQQLKSLLESSQEELQIARELQKFLHPNRIAKVPGVECLARYMSAQELFSEGFDFLTPKDPSPRESWFVANWTESFGMSSLLLQTLMRLQSEFVLGRGSPLTPKEFFKEVWQSLEGARKKGKFRLLVGRLNHHSLKFEGVSLGFAPFAIRKPQPSRQLSSWEWADRVWAEGLMNQTNPLAPSITSDVASRQVEFGFTLSPGSRLCFLSPGWAGTFSFSEYQTLWSNINSVALSKGLSNPQSGLVDDLNALLLLAEDHAKENQISADISSIVWEVSPTKLHLA